MKARENNIQGTITPPFSLPDKIGAISEQAPEQINTTSY